MLEAYAKTPSDAKLAKKTKREEPQISRIAQMESEKMPICVIRAICGSISLPASWRTRRVGATTRYDDVGAGVPPKRSR